MLLLNKSIFPLKKLNRVRLCAVMVELYNIRGFESYCLLNMKVLETYVTILGWLYSFKRNFFLISLKLFLAYMKRFFGVFYSILSCKNYS